MKRVKPTIEQLENREQWLVTLRGDKYGQQRSYLYDQKQQNACCLGVAALCAGLYVHETDGHDEDANYITFPSLDGSTERRNDLPPQSWIAERFGVGLQEAQHIIELGAGMNDGSVFMEQAIYMDPLRKDKGFTFPEIADAMEWAFAVHDFMD